MHRANMRPTTSDMDEWDVPNDGRGEGAAIEIE
jgi:hypothetical protein